MSNREVAWFLGGLGAGAGLMFFLDPRMGKRRRAITRDQLVSRTTRAGRSVVKLGVNLKQRTVGRLREAEGRFAGQTVDDDTLVRRVASVIGHHVAHSRALGITAENGRVILTGPVLASELDDLLLAVNRVRGVKAVEHRLQVHETAGNIPDLQGEGNVPRQKLG